jgi:hypothetical protein
MKQIISRSFPTGSSLCPASFILNGRMDQVCEEGQLVIPELGKTFIFTNSLHISLDKSQVKVCLAMSADCKFHFTISGKLA